ncbi:penicillin-binding protein 1C [Alcaligenes faecalis]|uniref:penicillin-binding protein 1C n=1 Tax=Alcaligenes TaxID=507 RepID=UPI002041C4F0|nr:penicillin-binding protein 1C [Alcaligenes faecalis]MCM2557428.1 penicillin-binding protein 1C [Alcaligenes faecalis]MCM2620430.1 penicillin-binding protein 1C [Alcaligenes faecalis]MDK7585354.1 penicillin-binding protein 1C [Alcaligenes phenolicus]
MPQPIKAGLLVLGLALWASPGQAMPSYKEVRQAYRSSDVQVLDRQGQLVQRVRLDFRQRRGDWVALEQISPALQMAVLVSEDRRFESHGGVDWLSVGSAAWDGLFAGRSRGASTITMQLAGLMDQDLIGGRGGRSVWQKLDQVVAAQSLEDTWTKPEILEAYLNQVAFRGELVGVDAMARTLFQKQAAALDARESAIAAVLLRGPNASALMVERRACTTLQEMGRAELCRELSNLVPVALRRAGQAPLGQAQLAPHFARWVLDQNPEIKAGDSIRTTLDTRLQTQVQASMRRHLLDLRTARVQDSAVVVLDNHSGQVLAYVGSSGDLSEAAEVDHARSLRQAGSTLKPFLYEMAIEKRLLTAASLLEDSPLNLSTGNGLYIPQNYDKQFVGWVSARNALASSLNIPAVRVLTMLGPANLVDRLRALGLNLRQDGDFYGYSLALGSADVTLLELTNAYRALANLGQTQAVQTRMDQQAAPFHSVMDEGASWIVGDMLSDRQARVLTFGLDSALSTPFWSAVKTGTSKDMRDNWALGWTEHYTVGVWVGNSAGQSMQDVSGVSGAAPIWHEVISLLNQRRPGRQTAMPAQVQVRQIEFVPAMEPGREEFFVEGTQTDRVELSDVNLAYAGPARIREPVNGTIFALDPDIPPQNQQLRLLAQGQITEPLVWWVQGVEAGKGAQLRIPLVPGTLRIELKTEQGRLMDQVSVQIRGAQMTSFNKD